MTNENATANETANETAINNLTAGWYNSIVTALGLDDTTFQLIQASLPLGADSTGLYQMADSVPPLSVTTYFSTSEWNRFSSDYKELLFAMSPGATDDALQNVLGDAYPTWLTFRSNYFTNNPNTTDTQLQVFTMFANQQLDPGVAQQAIQVFEESEISPVNDAINAFLNQSNFFQGNPVYNQTIADVKTAILSGKTANINFDSATADTDISHTWASGSVGGFIDFFDFEGEGSASYDSINSNASSSGVTVTGTISKYVTVPIGPGGWFDSGVFNNAYKNKDNNYVWNVASQTTWETCFGDSGSMPRVISELIVVDGIDIVVTSKASYSTDDVTTIQTHAEGGFFPFFMASSDTSQTTHVTHNDDASISISIKSNIGNPMILGVNVVSTADAFNN